MISSLPHWKLPKIYFLNLILQLGYIVKMNPQKDIETVRQSTKSLNKFKSVPIEERINLLSSQLLLNSKGSSKSKQYKPSIAKPVKKSQEQLIKRINLLQHELKKKISEDTILRNFFKTLNSSKLSHIDIFLELKKFQEIIEPLQNKVKQDSQKQSKYQQYINNLQVELQEKEQQYILSVMKLENEIEEDQRNHKKQSKHLRQKVQNIENELNATSFLVIQLKKKNEYLIQQNKSLNKKYQDTVKQQEIITQNYQQSFTSKLRDAVLEKEESVFQLQLLKRRNADLTMEIDSLYASKAFNQKIKDLYQQSQLKLRSFNQIEQEISLKDSRICDLLQQVQDTNLKISQAQCRASELQLLNDQKILKLQAELDQTKTINHNLSKNIETLSILIEKYKINDSNYMKTIRQMQQKYSLSILNHQKEKIELMSEKNKERFQENEVQSLLRKFQVESQQKQRQIEKIQKRIIDITYSNELMIKKYDEIKKQLEHQKSYEKVNQKVYCENYKAAGRLMQVGKQIAQVLNIVSTDIFNKNEESLQDVTSSLAKMSQLLIVQFKKCAQITQSQTKKRESRFKEILSILNYLKKMTGIENLQFLIDKYLHLIQNQNDVIDQNSNSEVVDQAYYTIIQRLVNAQNTKKFMIEDSLNTVRDSLESIELKNYRKGEQINKQNLDINEVQRIEREPFQKPSCHFENKNTTSRQSNNLSNFRRPSSNNRSEIQRKYFRG